MTDTPELKVQTDEDIVAENKLVEQAATSAAARARGLKRSYAIRTALSAATSFAMGIAGLAGIIATHQIAVFPYPLALGVSALAGVASFVCHWRKKKAARVEQQENDRAATAGKLIAAADDKIKTAAAHLRQAEKRAREDARRQAQQQEHERIMVKASARLDEVIAAFQENKRGIEAGHRILFSHPDHENQDLQIHIVNVTPYTPAGAPASATGKDGIQLQIAGEICAVPANFAEGMPLGLERLIRVVQPVDKPAQTVTPLTL